MIKDNYTSAPACASLNALYDIWKRDNNLGSLDDFYALMVLPSVERDAFLASCERSVRLVQGVGADFIVTTDDLGRD